jgi:hypothetical protein
MIRRRRQQGTPATHKPSFSYQLEFIVLRSMDCADTLKTHTDHLLRLHHFIFPTEAPYSPKAVEYLMFLQISGDISIRRQPLQHAHR